MLNRAIYRIYSNNPPALTMQYNPLITISLIINTFRDGLFYIIHVIRSYRRARGGGESAGAIGSYSNGGIRHALLLTRETMGGPYANALGCDLRVVACV